MVLLSTYSLQSFEVPTAYGREFKNIFWPSGNYEDKKKKKPQIWLNDLNDHPTYTYSNNMSSRRQYSK